MKKLVLGMIIATSSITANARGFTADIDINLRGNNSAQQCNQIVRVLDKENSTLKNQLRAANSSLAQCYREARRGQNNNQVRTLKEDLVLANKKITKLENTIDRKNDTIQDLSRDIQDLRDQLNPTPVGINLAAVIKACEKISSNSSANNCVSSARKYQVNAKRIAACTTIRSSSSAAKCVVEAGVNNTNTKQIKACVQISSSSSAVSCVRKAGAGRVPGNVVQACVDSSSSSSLQVRCVEQMAN